MTTPDNLNLPKTDEAKWCRICGNYAEHYAYDHPELIPDKPPTDTNPGVATLGYKDKLAEYRRKVLDKIHLNVGTAFFTEHQKDMQFLADDIIEILAAALQEQDIRSRLAELQLVNPDAVLPWCNAREKWLREQLAKQQEGDKPHAN